MLMGLDVLESDCWLCAGMYCGFVAIAPYYNLRDGHDGEYTAFIFKVKEELQFTIQDSRSLVRICIGYLLNESQISSHRCGRISFSFPITESIRL
jgi:hypothetical protein